MSCEIKPTNRTIPTTLPNPTFQVEKESQSSKTQNNYVTEQLYIGGHTLKVYKLLGIHEQHQLSPLGGDVIANGEFPEFLAANVSKNDCSEWHSPLYCGTRNINQYIGYDFGPIKLRTGQTKYAIHTEVKYHVCSLLLQQGDLEKNRISKARIERSDDGKIWKGVAIISMPNDNQEHWIDVKQSAPSRYWRLVPTEYLGKETDLWIVKKLSFSEYAKTSLNNTQADIFLEMRDRSYSTEPVDLKAMYDLHEIRTDLSQFGIELKDQYTAKMGFDLTVSILGRPIIIGDIVEVPCEVQYDRMLNPIKKLLEVTDINWDTGSFSTSWQSTTYMITFQPVISSQETADLFGNLNSDFFDSVETFNTTAIKSSEILRAESNTLVPERGANRNENNNLPQSFIDKVKNVGLDLSHMNINPTDVHMECGMPPDGLPYTEGDNFPENPKDKDYHRMTYSNLEDPVAPRLYRYNLKNNRWVFMEQDKRFRANSTRPPLDTYSAGVDITKYTK
jgi:hypothetical protein